MIPSKNKPWYQPNNSYDNNAAEESVHDGECWCFDCDVIRRRDGVIGVLDVRMNLCPDCGNKRCPKATNHENL